MAVTINGDGTISGIGVGGLPDGSVDSDKLATGIDATKLADGTITNSELQYINSLSSNAQTQISGVGGGGKVLQIVSTFTGASSSGSGAIPLDNTIPQAGAGHEVMSLAVTPQESDSKLWIQVVVTGCTNNQGDFSLALFQDSTANALACSRAKSGQSYGGDMDTNSLSWVMTSGTTSETTFKVEIGGHGTSTGYFNWQNYNTGGSYATQIYGGVANSGIIIMEISA